MTQYYIVADGRKEGPFSIEDLASRNITADTLVWRAGLDNWLKASELPELSAIILPPMPPEDRYAEREPHTYFAMINERRIGPASPRSLIEQGLTPDTPVWRTGMADWMPAYTQKEITDAFATRSFDAAVPPPAPVNYTNWLPWAIAATILSLLTSCIGMIFGIIGIVQANKANEAYATGNNALGDSSNKSARLMTIIAFVISGLGLFAITKWLSTIGTMSLLYNF